MWNNTKMTLELREIIESGVDIWDFDYPSYYKGDDKKAFEQKVIDHFYFRQIGFETVGRFKHQLKSKVREIMPYYLQLYKSVEIMDKIEDPFGNVDITETFEQTSTGQSSGTAQSNSSNSSAGQSSGTSKMLDTPEGQVTLIDDGYLTRMTQDEGNSSQTDSGESSSTTSSENSGTVRHTFTKKGNQGVNTYAHDMFEYRKSFINVDMQVIEELNCLFLGVY